MGIHAPPDTQLVGLSGTVGFEDAATRLFLARAWGFPRTVAIPEFRPTLRKMVVPVVAGGARVGGVRKHQERDRGDWTRAILQEVAGRSQTQPVLVVTQCPEDARHLQSELREQTGIIAPLYEAASDQHLLKGGEMGPGDVLVTTNLGGRGSDYKVAKRVEHGLHAIICYDTDEQRILDQAIGRCGRAGSPGTYVVIFRETERQKKSVSEVSGSIRGVVTRDLWFTFYRVFSEVIDSVPSIAPANSDRQEQPRTAGEVLARFFDVRNTGELRVKFLWWLSSRGTGQRLEPALRAAVAGALKSGMDGPVSHLAVAVMRDFDENVANGNRGSACFFADEKRGVGNLVSSQYRAVVQDALSERLRPQIVDLVQLDQLEGETKPHSACVLQ